MDGLVIGMQFIVIVSAFTAFGYWLDRSFANNFPIFLIVFLILGFVIGLYIMLKESSSFAKRESGRNKKGKRDNIKSNEQD